MPHSDDLDLLKSILEACRLRKAPAQLSDAMDIVGAGYQSFQRVMEQEAPPSIYGVNTLPGHREGLEMPEGYVSRYQSELIENHCLPQSRFFDPETGVCIHMAKCCSLAGGRSLVSPDLFGLLVALTADKTFEAIVPKEASYSSGDVIPAAYWARAVLSASPEYQLKPGEGMALINGAFVHVGVMLRVMQRLEGVWRRYLINSRHLFGALSANESFVDGQLTGDSGRYQKALKYITQQSHFPSNDELQPPVSCRAIPQVLDALLKAILSTAQETQDCLFRSSGNPQIRTDVPDEPRVLPSGSFVLPALALVSGQLIDALLMAAWNVSRRMEYLLSGKVASIPLDAATHSDPIGLIQWPKLAAAKLERMRMLYSRRVFGSGATTSYGIEDFWTNGTLTAEQLLDCLGDLMELLEFEHLVLTSAINSKRTDLKTSAAELSVAADNLPSELCLL